MQQTQPYYRRHIICCLNTREADAGRESCGDDGKQARDIHAALKDYVAAHKLKKYVRVSKSQCQDLCARGPIVAIHPDNVIYAHVTLDDVPAIIEKHIREFENLTSGKPPG